MAINFSGLSNEPMILPANGFQGGFWVTDKKATNTDGGAFSSGAWRKRDLNEIEFSWGNVGTNTLSSSNVTLSVGWWLLRWSAPAIRVGRHNTYLGTSWGGVQYGTCARIPTGGYHVENRSFGWARFYFGGGGQSFAVYHKCDDGQSSSYGFGDGQMQNPRFTEVYCLKYEYDTAGATP